MSCLEQNFAMIGTIEAFDLNALSEGVNLYLPNRTLSASPMKSGASPTLVPLHPGSAKLSENAVRSRAGDSYEVALSWQVRTPSAADIAVLEAMKRSAKHLRITAFHNAVAYILADADHYQMDYERSGEFIDCTVKVCSVNGIQQVL